MNQLLVSVIIPTFNRRDTVERAILSATSQTMGELEVLVCDDGSTDGTESLVRGFGDTRVKWVAGAHSGRPAVPRNRGISLAGGVWLAFLDSDDRWLPDKLERQLQRTISVRGSACSTNAYRVHEGCERLDTLLSYRKDSITLSDLVRDNSVICSSVVVRKEVMTSTGGFPEEIALGAPEDYAAWLRVATRCNFVYLPEPLLYYSDDEGSSIRRDTDFRTLAEQQEVIYPGWSAWCKRSGVKRHVQREFRMRIATNRVRALVRRIRRSDSRAGLH